MSTSSQNEPAPTQATKPPTPEQLIDLRGFEAAATPGPWGSERDLAGVYTVQARPRVIPGVGMAKDGDVAVVCPAGSDAETYANTRFIAMTRTAVPALLAEIERLQRAYIFDTADLKRRVDEQAREIERLKAQLASTEDRVRESIAQDFIRQGKASGSLNWGQAVYIAREGLCGCSGGVKPCDMGSKS